MQFVPIFFFNTFLAHFFFLFISYPSDFALVDSSPGHRITVYSQLETLNLIDFKMFLAYI